jgi:hypothetical protein
MDQRKKGVRTVAFVRRFDRFDSAAARRVARGGHHSAVEAMAGACRDTVAHLLDEPP